MDRNTYPNLNDEKFVKLTNTILEERKRSKEVFVKHFDTKYGK